MCLFILKQGSRIQGNHIVYTLATDPTNMHIFGRNEDVMGDFYRFKNEADKHFDLQKIGMNNP